MGKSRRNHEAGCYRLRAGETFGAGGRAVREQHRSCLRRLVGLIRIIPRTRSATLLSRLFIAENSISAEQTSPLSPTAGHLTQVPRHS